MTAYWSYSDPIRTIHRLAWETDINLSKDECYKIFRESQFQQAKWVMNRFKEIKNNDDTQA